MRNIGTHIQEFGRNEAKGSRGDILQTNGVTNLQGDWTISHLRVLITLLSQLQRPIKNRLNPASRPLEASPDITIPAKDFGMGPSNGMRLREVLTELTQKLVHFPDRHFDALLKGYSYPSRSATITLQLDKALLDYLLDCSGGYTYYSADIAFRIKRKHTLRLYWLVCSWRNRGGLTLPLSQIRTLLGLGPAYDRPDNIVTHVLTPAKAELEALGHTWFDYKLADDTLTLKIHYTMTEEERQQLTRDTWDQCFKLLTAAGLSFRLLDDIFPRIRPEDLPSFVQKLQSLLLTLAARRDLRSPAAYIHKALESWLDSQ